MISYTSGFKANGTEWTVEKQYLKIIQPAQPTNPADLKYIKIITKMKSMEAKRKELGYKTYGDL